MNDELLDKLKALDIEDFIWGVLIVLILLSFYGNMLERDYLINGDVVKKDKYRYLTIFIFSVALLTYFYYANDSRKSFKNLKITDNNHKKFYVSLSYVASILIVIAGIIFVYIAVNDTELDVELAYN